MQLLKITSVPLEYEIHTEAKKLEKLLLDGVVNK